MPVLRTVRKPSFLIWPRKHKSGRILSPCPYLGRKTPSTFVLHVFLVKHQNHAIPQRLPRTQHFAHKTTHLWRRRMVVFTRCEFYGTKTTPPVGGVCFTTRGALARRCSIPLLRKFPPFGGAPNAFYSNALPTKRRNFQTGWAPRMGPCKPSIRGLAPILLSQTFLSSITATQAKERMDPQGFALPHSFFCSPLSRGEADLGKNRAFLVKNQKHTIFTIISSFSLKTDAVRRRKRWNNR